MVAPDPTEAELRRRLAKVEYASTRTSGLHMGLTDRQVEAIVNQLMPWLRRLQAGREEEET